MPGRDTAVKKTMAEWDRYNSKLATRRRKTLQEAKCLSKGRTEFRMCLKNPDA